MSNVNPATAKASLFSRFLRRRTAFYAGLWIGGALGLGVWATDMGLPYWAHVLAAVATWVAAMFAFVWLCRKQSPILPMRYLSVVDQAALIGTEPAGRAMLLIVIPPERFGFYRLDVLLDDVHLGQLKPGTGFLLPIRPGDRRIEIFAGTRGARDMAYFSTRAGKRPGFKVHAIITKVTYLHIKPWTVLGEWSPASVGDIRLVEPLASDV